MGEKKSSSFRYICSTCDQIHEGIPSFGADFPLSYYEIPDDERSKRCKTSTDDCIIDDAWFFVRGCIELPVLGHSDPFIWGVWCSLSQENFLEWRRYYTSKQRSHVGPFFGWLNAAITGYPDTINLKTMVHLRDNGLRPFIELEPTDHPLAIEQRDGISTERVIELSDPYLHPR